MLTLWDTWACPYCQRVRIVLEEKQLAHEIVAVDLARKPQRLFTVNPAGAVPVLEEDGAAIPESLVISEYLEERFPEPRLAPVDPVGRARMRLLFTRCDVLLAAPSSKLVKGGAQERPGAEAAIRIALERIERDVPADGFLLGPFTLADVAFAPFLARLPPHLLPDAAAHPRLARWRERVLARESVAKHTRPR